MTQPTMTSRIWLHMLKEGGHWTAAELSRVAGCSRDRADTLLWSLSHRGFVTAHRGTERKNGRTYGVGRLCKVPDSVTLQEILAAIGTGMAQELQAQPEPEPRPRISSVFAMGAGA